MIDLHHSLGAIEIERDVVRVAGPDAVAYLQGQLSQDVEDLDVGSAALSFLLAPTGKVDAWLRVTRRSEDELILDLDGGHGEAVLARLRRFLLRTKADVDPLAWRAVALRGPGAEAAAREAAGDGEAGLAVPAMWPGVEGADLLGPDVAAPPGVGAADRAAYESLRIRAGVPALGAELTDATIPAEAGQAVIDASVDFTKGCFTGQELVARIDSRGGHVPRRVRGILVPDGSPAAEDAVVVDGREVGRVTSVAPHPGGGTVALGIVARAVEPPAAAEVTAAGGPVAATVVDLPIEG
jgi:tRNA-modifying protein YgfZ